MTSNRARARRSRSALVALLGVLAAGCALTAPPDPGHYMMTHADGYATNPDRDLLDQGEFSRQYVEPILTRLDTYLAGPLPEKRVVLFIHGGMNGLRAGLARATQFWCLQQRLRGAPPAGAPGACTNHWRWLDEYETGLAERRLPNPLAQLKDAHLIFVNWNSGTFGSLGDDLCCIRQGARRPLLGWLTLPFKTLSRLLSSVFLLPESIAYQADTALAGFQRPEAGDACLAPTGQRPLTFTQRLQGALESLQAPPEQEEPEEKPEFRGIDAATAATYALALPLRYLSVPVIQGFGTPAWDIMKRRAHLAVAPEPTLEARHGIREGAIRTLLKALAPRLEAARAGGRKIQLVLVGHSMGTIVANDILADELNLYFDRIVYVGAAATIADVRESVFPYLRDHPETVFWSFSLAESFESNEVNGADLYERGSLLVWIDNLFERVGEPDQRTFGRAQNLLHFLKVPPEIERRVHLVRFEGRKRRDFPPYPRKHGDFDNPPVLSRILSIARSPQCDAAVLGRTGAEP